MIGFTPKIQLTQWGPFVCLDKFLASHECSKLIAQMSDRKMLEAKVSESGVKNDVVRSTKMCGLEAIESNAWIFRRLEEACSQCNDQVYKMDLLGFHEAINLLYYQKRDFYDWHMDSGNLQFSNRKLSIVIQLSDPADYEGGELEFFRNGMAPKEKGSMVLFPSYMYHRVTEVTEGDRRTLVAWINGNPFR